MRFKYLCNDLTCLAIYYNRYEVREHCKEEHKAIWKQQAKLERMQKTGLLKSPFKFGFHNLYTKVTEPDD